MANIRYTRINEEVKKAISEIVREMKDPRISSMTTIMSAEVTNDLKQAKVRVSVYDPDDAVREASVAALNRAAGFIRHELGSRIDIRALPQLKFILDNSIEYSVHIAKILNDLNKDKKDREEQEEN
ncbi:MAG: 30S ribosome-binding factor RbfA [Clostridia bacterium]|nr:30S ribosome-binding factor RbfA [Clostridia bacterium]MBQ7114750.1 30S ribosome-binding factor RbfA [Clostridia bacterium]